MSHSKADSARLSVCLLERSECLGIKGNGDKAVWIAHLASAVRPSRSRNRIEILQRADPCARDAGIHRRQTLTPLGGDDRLAGGRP